ncbi:MAG: tRNA (adenosine(37)-N6)-threonylcarbamoyltransferase complex dimerization subunit type 1 TsaB [Heliobacteriaceae bacterium]|jgi:tRNA threonylcarbamoyl adenosine modification protein YeaZ|nr:tRNA (adenosine(37)-N6)-threonylcarbamoyltransferase complex dimerization subunit type 1 TsaB [Heliobacteriaceae bacterium]
MITLGFDTALDKMYVVLKKNGVILASKIVETTESKYHSAFLISTIKEALSGSGLRPQDLDLIAADTGPGSFTGIRACITAARVMAQQLESGKKPIKAIGVSSLEILSKLNTTGMPTLAALNAGKNSAYLWLNGKIKGAVPLEEINTDGYFVVTDDKLQHVLGGISYQQGNYQLGEILVQTAEEKNEAGNWQNLLPLYIQPPGVHVK